MASELENVTAGVRMHAAIHAYGLDSSYSLSVNGQGPTWVWIFPRQMFTGLTEAYGLPIVHADVETPYLAYQIPPWEMPDPSSYV